MTEQETGQGAAAGPPTSTEPLTSTEPPTSTEPLTSAEPYRSGRARAAVTLVLLLLFVLVSLASILSSLLRIGLLEGAAGGDIPEDMVAVNDLREGLIALLLALVNLATVVAFCFWVHRAYRNLRALGNLPSALEYSPGWAVGYFFIPILNLFMPYRVVREIWQKSDPAVRTRDDLTYAVASSAPLVLTWWLAWIAANFLDRAVSRFYGDAETSETLAWASKADIFSTALWIAAAVLAALVVRGIDRRQEERSRHVVYAAQAPPPPPLFTPGPAGG